MKILNSGANLNFDRLRHVTERAEIGEGNEVLLSVKIPEVSGSFRAFCEVIGRRSISEFNYRFSSNESANVFVGIKTDNISRDMEKIFKDLNEKKLVRHTKKTNNIFQNYIQFNNKMISIDNPMKIMFKDFFDKKNKISFYKKNKNFTYFVMSKIQNLI